MTRDEFEIYLYTYIEAIATVDPDNDDAINFLDCYFRLMQGMSGIDLDLLDAFVSHLIRCDGTDDYTIPLIDTIECIIDDGYNRDEMISLRRRYGSDLEHIYTLDDFYDYVYDEKHRYKNPRLN